MLWHIVNNRVVYLRLSHGRISAVFLVFLSLVVPCSCATIAWKNRAIWKFSRYDFDQSSLHIHQKRRTRKTTLVTRRWQLPVWPRSQSRHLLIIDYAPSSCVFWKPVPMNGTIDYTALDNENLIKLDTGSRANVQFKPSKKMKKRRQLDALVSNGKKLPRRKQSGHELLRSNDSESSELEEFSVLESQKWGKR